MHFAQFAILVPLFPLAAFFVIVLLTNPNKRLSSTIAIGSLVLSAILSYLIFFQMLGEGTEEVLRAASSGQAPWTTVWSWIPVGLSEFKVGSYVDPLAAVMIVMVSTVGLMIFIYSQGYHNIQDPANTDPLYSRFFAYLSLFAAGMLGFVLSPNLVQALVFWEIMGLCSFLLIGFWFGKRVTVYNNGREDSGNVNSYSAKKAFLTTRVGDVFFILGVVGLWGLAGNIQYYELFQRETIQRLQEATLLIGSPTMNIAGLTFDGFGIAIPALALITLLLFGGAVGKSAQFPLHVWLPDAMAGPTPVSAMIHAATMVAAGVFLIARTYPLFAAAGGEGHRSVPLLIVAAIGTFTAIFAGTIGLAQNDIKKILAYSTVSQLGFMFAALGVGAWVAGVFHMITHAFFKALLFLGSGSVIHGMEHLHRSHAHAGHADHDAHGGHEDDLNKPVPGGDDPQDIYNMGGLRRRMPLTFWTYMMGALALTGIPIWAGFWSKDEILAHAFNEGDWLPWLVLTVAAGFTAFYMARQIFLVFFGAPRTELAEHAAESPRTITFPLTVLAIFATLVGLLGMPDLIGSLHVGNWFHHLVGLVPTTGLAEEVVAEAEAPTSLNFLVATLSTGIAILGWVLGYLVYGRRVFRASDRDPLERLGGVWNALKNKYWVDELYGTAVERNMAVWRGDRRAAAVDHDNVVQGAVGFSRFNAFIDQWIIDRTVNLVATVVRGFSVVSRWIDQNIVDGAVNGVGTVTGALSSGLRLIQTGLVQNYLLVVFLSILVLSGIYLVMR